MFRMIPVLLILLLALAHRLSAQSPGGSGKPSPTVSTSTIPRTPANLPPTDTTPRSLFLSGKVMVDDGTLLTDSVIIQSICKGRIRTEGHTDSKPYTGGREYGNWELSADRANAARRLMQSSGLRADQVTQVRGYADQMPRKKDQPLDASNRRRSLRGPARR